jgi:uncharacterized membrane protein YkgB
MPFKLQKQHLMKIEKILIYIIIIAVFLLLIWFALKHILNTEYPILPVSSGNMCIVSSRCDGFTHPFEPTLHLGDLVIVQGVNATAIECNYPYSEILVFHAPKQGLYDEDRLIITRAIAKQEINGTIYFLTKSDGEGVHKWPEPPDMQECNYYYGEYTYNGAISEKLLIGKVVLRIPWVGHLALFMHNFSGIFLIAIFTIILLIIQILKGKQAETKQAEGVGKAFST